MLLRHLAVLAALTVFSLYGCRDKAKHEPMSKTVPAWIPLAGNPLPGHGESRHVRDPSVRKLTPDELVTIAARYHPRMGDPETYSIEEWDKAFWNSPEQVALSKVQYEGYARLPAWKSLCDAVTRSIPSVFTVAERTYPRYYPTYMMVVDAPVEQGSITERFLVVHLSYLVPYYFYYELHSRRVDGLIQRDPLRYEVTAVFEEVLAAIEREIAARYGYWRMPPDIARIAVPGIEVNGYHGWETGPPSLQDALFTPQRW